VRKCGTLGDDQAQRAHLVAPCGMDCGVCGAYLAHSHDVPRQRGVIAHCSGCRARGKRCAYLKGHCSALADGDVDFCFECADYACARLQHLDSRYRERYGMSLIENLDVVREAGVAALIDRQQARFACARCGRLRSVHNQKCYVCDEVRTPGAGDGA
jgi:hypothetical protein